MFQEKSTKKLNVWNQRNLLSRGDVGAKTMEVKHNKDEIGKYNDWVRT